MVGGGPGCLAEIVEGWSEIFGDITAGYPEKSEKKSPRVVRKADVRHPLPTFSNGIALIKDPSIVLTALLQSRYNSSLHVILHLM